MLLGKIAGTVVATRKDEKLQGKKLLIVRIIDPETGDELGYQVAIDTVGAGAGETVIIVSGSSARMASGWPIIPSTAPLLESWTRLTSIQGLQLSPHFHKYDD